MDAIDLLIQDHQTVRTLFEQAQQTADSVEKREIYERIKGELLLHAEVEQAHFFPEFIRDSELAELIDEALVEQDEIQELLEEIDETDDSEEIGDLLEELRDAFEHHVEEEEGGLFPRIRKAAPEARLTQLAEVILIARGEAPHAA